ncbi:holo-ACP synthase [Candidatus Protofrankia californiensis]|uniref:holo-ACP synthase n=1 Tax=Candidatus Protofrankia californiensis TaxID=1839754 RepID=UPI0010413AA7|nr:holo-ACP synthase [Candidatus Protofrankia californiensis]
MAVVGVGVDVVDVERFAATLRRAPSLVDRLFTISEQKVASSEKLAARFAAKEALAKALGAPPGMSWHDAEVVGDPGGRPRIRVTGTVAAVADSLAIRSWHLSLTHDGGLAVAFVVAEG